MIRLPVFQSTASIFFYTIVLGDARFIVKLMWNSRSENWHITVTDENTDVINGVKVVGNWPLLSSHRAQITMDGDLVVIPLITDPPPLTYDNLGTEWQLVYMTSDELAAWSLTNGLG